eukprot:scaffold3759_cov124-Skeletonema_dohrnii-CCMP3373.AAC.5
MGESSAKMALATGYRYRLARSHNFPPSSKRLILNTHFASALSYLPYLNDSLALQSGVTSYPGVPSSLRCEG